MALSGRYSTRAIMEGLPVPVLYSYNSYTAYQETRQLGLCRSSTSQTAETPRPDECSGGWREF